MTGDMTPLQDEIKDTLEHNYQSYVYWCALSDKVGNNNKVKLTVRYDMGWQKRSSGRRYESSIGNTFIIGGISKGIFGYSCSSASSPIFYIASHFRQALE